ncbi:MAG TPA: hypothetical protein VK579_14130 [Terriglobales bacterium]|nr:hypothetical protein [Terriglobales bacterium]
MSETADIRVLRDPAAKSVPVHKQRWWVVGQRKLAPYKFPFARDTISIIETAQYDA